MNASPLSHTYRLGEALTRFGVEKGAELVQALGIQSYLERGGDLTLLAAGQRQSLGGLLLDACHLKKWQVDKALAQQSASKKPIGQILIDHNWLAPAELDVALIFQRNQNYPAPNAALQLGNVLVANGDISPEQLTQALEQRLVSGARLGDALVAGGHATSAQIERGLLLQRKLVAAVLFCALALSSVLAPIPAEAASLSANVQVSATVRASAHLKTAFQANSIIITQDDIARGYVDVANASQFSVRATKGGNYVVDFQVRSELFHSVSIEGLGSHVKLGQEGGAVSQVGAGIHGVASNLSYRFDLRPGIQTGVYEFPLVLAVRAQ